MLVSWSITAATILVAYLLFFASPAPAQAQSSAEPTTYTIVTGDTLFNIAARYGVSLDDLAAFNGIANVDLIEPGQVLTIPAASSQSQVASAVSTAYALPGDTLVALASRLQQDAAILADLNAISESSSLFPGQPIKLPVAYTPVGSASFGAVADVLLDDVLVQGKTGRILVSTRRPIALQATWNGLPLVFTPVGDNPLRQFALVPVPALLATGPYSLILAYPSTNGIVLSKSWLVDIVEGDYGLVDIVLPPDRGELLAPELIRSELELLTEKWSEESETLMHTGVFSRPVPLEWPTSDPYGTRRSYDGGPYASYHAGHDFATPVSITVTAPGNGVVVLSQPLNVRGDAILIDHGRGIFTGYWHLSESFVQPGQQVKMGEPIALSGNTGLSTGAHLHWELRVYGIAVDPMQFLETPLQSDQ